MVGEKAKPYSGSIMSASRGSRARELGERRARLRRVAQARAQVRVVDEQLDELAGRPVDDHRQLVRDERLDDLRRGDHGVAAAQRHRGVPGLAVHDEAELRRALLAALEQVDAPVGVLDEVRRRPR